MQKTLPWVYEKRCFTTHYAYMLCCSDGTVYCGYTTDLSRRTAEHNSGVGAKYTHSRIPVSLAYYEEFDTKSEAMRREAALKKLTHAQKAELIRSFTD